MKAASTVEEKLDILVEQYARNRSDLAMQIGVSAQTMNNWVYRNKIPRLGIAAITRRFPDVRNEWLEGSSAPSSALFVTDFAVTCGDADMPEQREDMQEVKVPIKGVKHVFRCSGDSMEPMISNGDYVGIGEAMGRFESFSRNEIYLVITRTGGMVKMVEDPGSDVPYLQLSTLNRDYELSNGGRLPKEDFRAAYKVLMIMKEKPWKTLGQQKTFLSPD